MLNELAPMPAMILRLIDCALSRSNIALLAPGRFVQYPQSSCLPQASLTADK